MLMMVGTARVETSWGTGVWVIWVNLSPVCRKMDIRPHAPALLCFDKRSISQRNLGMQRGNGPKNGDLDKNSGWGGRHGSAYGTIVAPAGGDAPVRSGRAAHRPQSDRQPTLKKS